MRARVIQQAWPVLNELASLDAVMIHLFEADVYCSLRSYLHRTPIHVSSTDEAPITDRAAYPLYPSDLTKPVWRQKLRLAIDMWRVRHTDLFIPFSHWAAEHSRQRLRCSEGPGLPDARRPRPRLVDLPTAPANAYRRQAEDPLRRHRFRPQGRLLAARRLRTALSRAGRAPSRHQAGTEGCTRACLRPRRLRAERPPSGAPVSGVGPACRADDRRHRPALGLHGSDGDAAPRDRHRYRRQQGARPTRQDGADRQDRRWRGTRRRDRVAARRRGTPSRHG